MPIWLFVLLLGAFTLYTDDYVIAGLLPEIAADLDTTEPVAGQLVTVFSLTVAVMAPLVAVFAVRIPRRALIALCFTAFIGANAAAAVAPDIGWLLVFRALAAAGAAGATPAMFASAAARAPKNRVGRYVAFVSLGVTGSIALGVPIGTWIGGVWGWRSSFVVMAAAGAIMLIALLATFRSSPPQSVPTIRAQLRVLVKPGISLGLLCNLTLMAGTMMLLTYLASYLAESTGSGVDERAIAFGIAGVAGMIGVWGGGTATDRWGADRALAAGIAVIAICMAVLWLFWAVRPLPFIAVLPVLGVWGAAAFWNSPAIQTRLVSLAGPYAGQALALNTSGTYLGVSAGAALGAAAISGLGVGALPPLAGLCAVAAFILIVAARRYVPTQLPSGADADADVGTEENA